MNTTTRVSVATNGTQGNSNSLGQRISADGRFVSFYSFATNLVPNDTNAAIDVFVHDSVTGETTRESVATGGGEGNGNSQSEGAMSADGNIIVFASFATNLVAGDTNGVHDIFLRNRQTGVTQRVSLSSAGAQGNGASQTPDLSYDGRFVSFTSDATNLIAGDTNGFEDAFRRDLQTSTTVRVSVSSAGVQADERSFFARISGDGGHVVFSTSATNLVAGDTNAETDIFVRNVGAQLTYRVSIATNGTQANSYSGSQSINKDGSIAAFYSTADNLVGLDTNEAVDAFVHDSNIVPALFNLVRGTVEDGTADRVLFSDDERFIIRPGVTLSTAQAPVEIIVESESIELGPSRLEFAVEFHATSASIRQTLELFNFDSQAYELVDTRQATTSDAVALVAITSNPGRFVSSTGLMRTRIRYRAIGPVLAFPWRTRLDHIRWTVFD
jgi:hypothetical protein